MSAVFAKFGSVKLPSLRTGLLINPPDFGFFDFWPAGSGSCCGLLAHHLLLSQFH